MTHFSSAGAASVNVEFVWGSDPQRKYDELVRELLLHGAPPELTPAPRATQPAPAALPADGDFIIDRDYFLAAR